MADVLGAILLLVTPAASTDMPSDIRKRVLVGGGSVDRWHGHIEQSQIDDQLFAVVTPVIDAL